MKSEWLDLGVKWTQRGHALYVQSINCPRMKRGDPALLEVYIEEDLVTYS